MRKKVVVNYSKGLLHVLSDQNKDACTKNCNQVGLNHKSHKLFDERERERERATSKHALY